MSIEGKSRKETTLISARPFLRKASGGSLTLGKLLESIRLGEETSQAEFARRLKVSRMYLCDLEKGRRNVSLKKASDMAKALGYGQAQFCRLAVQDQAAREGLRIQVEIKVM